MVEDGPLTPELYAVLDSYPILHRVRNETNLGLGLLKRWFKGMQK